VVECHLCPLFKGVVTGVEKIALAREEGGSRDFKTKRGVIQHPGFIPDF